MRVVIVDDEPLAREGLRLMLAAYPGIEIAGEAGNGRDGLAVIERTRPDVVLLDVEMPELNGLELVAALPEDLELAIVFVTAFDEYAVRAFELHALHYLVKPVSEQGLAAAIDRVHSRHEQRTTSQLVGELRASLAARDEPSPPARDKLTIRDGQRIVVVPIETIDWIEAASYYVEIHVAGRVYLHRETMQRLSETLDRDRFLRIHRSCLVNRERIREIVRRGRGAVVVLSDGSSHEVARSYWSKVKLAHR